MIFKLKVSCVENCCTHALTPPGPEEREGERERESVCVMRVYVGACVHVCMYMCVCARACVEENENGERE